MMAKKVKVTKDGPYIVSGDVPLSVETIVPNEEGYSAKYEKGKSFPAEQQVALCRCGKSKHKPYCDGSHKEANFDGTETAFRGNISEISEKFEGPDITLYDAHELCAFARFCDRPRRAWTMAIEPKNEEETKRAIEEACDCPAGRLVAVDNRTGETYEPKLDEEITLLEDPAKDVSGPLYVKGGIEVESEDGHKYEVRNRQTLCRCGESSNKPFCDGTHASCKFKDDFLEKL